MSQIHIGTSLYPQRKAHTLRELLEMACELYSDTDAYIYRKEVQGEEYHVTYGQLKLDIRAFSAAFAKRGLDVGNVRIAMIGENSYPWVLSFNSAASYLGAAVPLDSQLPVDEALSLMERANVNVLCFGPNHIEHAREVAKIMPQVEYFINFDHKEDFDDLDGKALSAWKLVEEGKAMSQTDQDELLTYKPRAEDLASIVFTSGTTAQSKGVMLSHRNIALNAHSCAEYYDVKVGDRALSVLPLHHTFENTVGMFTFWYLGLTICINDGLRYIAKNLKDWGIGIMMVVPAVAESIHSQIMRSVRKQKLENKLKQGLRISKFLRFFRQDRRRTIFHSIISQLGGNLHLFVCGGAAMDPDVANFFNDIGIDCLPGYGLSEASPVLSCNLQTKCIAESVGWPIPDVRLKIDDSDLADDGKGNMVGEVLALGDNIMMGYLDNPEATEETMTPDGWLRTGDLGYFDDKGALHLTGRKKSMLVLSNGKKAFPEEIEGLLKNIPAVEEAFVWDEESKRGNVIICAKLQIKRDELPLSKNAEDEEISNYLYGEIQKVNRIMPVYKSVTAFIWTEEPMQMTTTLKVRRPKEKASIEADLAQKNLSIQEASGMRLPSCYETMEFKDF